MDVETDDIRKCEMVFFVYESEKERIGIPDGVRGSTKFLSFEIVGDGPSIDCGISILLH